MAKRSATLCALTTLLAVAAFAGSAEARTATSAPWSVEPVKVMPSAMAERDLTSDLPDGAWLEVAQGCLSPKQARLAVKQGRAQPLSRFVANIRAQTGGDILPNPQLCNSGGLLVYLVSVLTGGGQVRQATVDAASGAILGF